MHKNKINNLYLLYNLLILYSLVRLDKTKIFKTWKPRSKYFLYNLIMPVLTLAIQSQNQTMNQKILTLPWLFVGNASNSNTLWRCAILDLQNNTTISVPFCISYSTTCIHSHSTLDHIKSHHFAIILPNH